VRKNWPQKGVRERDIVPPVIFPPSKTSAVQYYLFLRSPCKKDQLFFQFAYTVFSIGLISSTCSIGHVKTRQYAVTITHPWKASCGAYRVLHVQCGSSTVPSTGTGLCAPSLQRNHGDDGYTEQAIMNLGHSGHARHRDSGPQARAKKRSVLHKKGTCNQICYLLLFLLLLFILQGVNQ